VAKVETDMRCIGSAQPANSLKVPWQRMLIAPRDAAEDAIALAWSSITFLQRRHCFPLSWVDYDRARERFRRAWVLGW
jgi:hypothetical protein